MNRSHGNIIRAHSKMRFYLGPILLFCFTFPIPAQFTTAKLNGSVVDPSGLALAGATVKVEQVGIGYTQSTTTGSTGEYLFPTLPVGTYQLTASLAGFNSYTQKGITLAVGQTVTVPVKLEIGTLQQRVTVVENASLVTSDSATLGQVIYQKDVVGLPLNGRYAQQLVFLVPGAETLRLTTVPQTVKAEFFPISNMPK